MGLQIIFASRSGIPVTAVAQPAEDTMPLDLAGLVPILRLLSKHIDNGLMSLLLFQISIVPLKLC